VFHRAGNAVLVLGRSFLRAIGRVATFILTVPYGLNTSIEGRLCRVTCSRTSKWSCDEVTARKATA
jgi:hypothetical protein